MLFQSPAVILISRILMLSGVLYYALALPQDIWGLVAALLGLILRLLAARANQKGSISRARLTLALGSLAGTMVVLVLAVMVVWLGGRHHMRWDFSQGGKHTLAPQSIKVVKGLRTPVKALAFFREQQTGRIQAQDLLDRYQYHNRAFSYEFVDLDRAPALAQKYGVRAFGTTVLIQKDKREAVKLTEEKTITNALIRLGRQGKKVIYFLKGHGEHSLTDTGREGYSQLSEAIASQNYQTETLLLAVVEKVPDNAALLVIAGGKKPLLAKEITRLGQYVARGGRLLVLLNPRHYLGLSAWLKTYGVEVGDDLVLDQASQLFGASPGWPLANEYGQHEITRPLEGIFCFFPFANSVRMAAKLPPVVTGLDLVKSSPQSWAETDLSALESGKAQFDQGKDLQGPVSLGVALTVRGEKPKAGKGDGLAPEAQMVVMGDSDFANNTHLEQAGNRDLMLNSLGFLAEEQDLISISPKETANQPLLLQPHETQLLFRLPAVILPFIFIWLGIEVVSRRRRPR